MPRRRVAERREVLPDPIYNSTLVTKFINGMMWGGKKSTAEQIFYGAMTKIGEKTGEEPLKGLQARARQRAPDTRGQIAPHRRCDLSGAARGSQDRRNTLAIRWIVQNARGRSEKTMADRLVGELLDAANNRGNAVKKKEDTHRMAEANKAFAHYKC